jgi:hypothetical protein
MILNRYFGLLAVTVGTALLQSGNAANYIPPASGYTINVMNAGAKGDGVTDDTPAIQAAISLLESQGGGILIVPAGTYLLNSYYPSPHPWFFHNILVGSNVFIQGAPGARFLQGPGGRAPIQPGATYVRNSVLVFGSANYVVNTFQNPAYNGGFYTLQATTADVSSVTLATPSQASNFQVGDYVAFYATTTGDVIPGETSQVTSVNASTGVLGLKWSIARPFASPAYIANVTGLATVNVGLSNLTVQGTETLVVQEGFNFAATNCQFISDTSITGNTWGPNLTTIRDFRFSGNQFASIGPSYISVQLPQRNSQTGVFEANTFIGENIGFGEYAAHWTLVGNSITAFSQATDAAMVAIGGLDVTFANNTVNGVGTVPMIADYVGLATYAAYVGDIVITRNALTCQVEGSNCILLASQNPTVTNNLIVARGGAVGIKVEGPLPQAASIQRNSIAVQSGFGIVLNTSQIDQSGVISNTITGSGPAGVYVASPTTPNTGGDVITGNCITGFTTPIWIDPNEHTGTIISSTAASTCPSLKYTAAN